MTTLRFSDWLSFVFGGKRAAPRLSSAHARTEVEQGAFRVYATITNVSLVGDKTVAVTLALGANSEHRFTIDSATAARFPAGTKLVGVFTKED